MFAKGAYWLIAFGLVGALAAALVGFLDLFAIPTGTKAFRIGLIHMTLNLVVVALFAVSFLVRRSDIDAPGEAERRAHRLVGGGARIARRVGLARRDAQLPLRRPRRRRDGAGQRVPRPRRRTLMDVAALITWVLTALGGFVMLGIWFATAASAPPRPVERVPGRCALRALPARRRRPRRVDHLRAQRRRRRVGVDGVRHPAPRRRARLRHAAALAGRATGGGRGRVGRRPRRSSAFRCRSSLSTACSP